MIKKLLSQIEKAEKEKQKKVTEQAELHAEIENIDADLKRLNSIKREYDKLQNNFNEFLNKDK